MPLPAGTRLGAYEVIGLLGQGGMGEVYRATRHASSGATWRSRLLPEASRVATRDRLARFEREAQVLAALNHPEHRARLRHRGRDGRRRCYGACPGDGARRGGRRSRSG